MDRRFCFIVLPFPYMTGIHASTGGPVLTWCVAVLTALALLHTAQAQTTPPDGIASGLVDFNIPAQPLDSALSVYSDVTGRTVFVMSKVTVGQHASAVIGRFSPDEALRKLLAGTLLRPSYASKQAFTLIPVPSSPPARAAAPSSQVPRLRDLPYASAIQQAMRQSLCASQRARPGAYRTVAQLWIDASGVIDDVHLLESTGSAATDAAIAASLRGVAPGRPPAGMPEPITVLLAPRDAGPTTECGAVAAARP